MSNGRGKHKSRGRRRTPKTSKGIHGATKHPLSEVGKALLGKGRVQTMKHVPCKSNWSGQNANSVVPFDPVQVEENKRLYPHLFD